VATDETTSPDERFEARIRRRQTFRLLAIAALALVAAALALDNLQDVTIGWVVGDTDAPLVIVLVVAFVLGLALGWLAGRKDGRVEEA
jgi:uncharacterized integral membrane protein